MPTSTQELTPKAAQTRERIFETALRLFAERGYAATTMRDIAAGAEVSLGLSYRYFATKDDLVLELYARLATALEQDVATLPPTPLAHRFVQTMRLKLARLEPYRAALGGLFGAALNPQSEVAVLGDRTAAIRGQVSRIFTTMVTGSSDIRPGPQARDLATVLYASHLLILLFWLHDRSRKAQATDELLALVGQALRLGRRLLRLPPFGALLARLAGIIGSVFELAEVRHDS